MGKTLSPGTIVTVTLGFYILFFGFRLFATYFPSSADKLRIAQDNIPSASGQRVDNLWAYYLINAENPLDESFTVGLDYVQGSFMLDERCAGYAKQMIADAQADGVTLTVVSAYRSVQKQQENLESYTERLIREGHTRSEARKLAEKEIMLPYTSEHNAGLALDILTPDWWETHDDITDDFENTEQFRWLSENAHKYGFIMRYPKEYENVTGIIYEPWHYRFVGVYYAEKIRESGLPFEYFYKTNF
ncbi:MAG: M15 family metallopeptidase [Ruminiclostridium sp.]|nr:M15 family metallopeptidase [Ruminiclostridium sp.]